MARTHGRIASSIWTDPDFLALDASAQRLYLFLLSQPDLTHAGLLPLRARRWAKKFADGSVDAVLGSLDTLAEARFIVMDEDTEEVLIRTFVRNDGVWKQPKVMLRMREDARLIESPMLRKSFADELHRIPLEDLSDKATGPKADQPSTRAVVSQVIKNLVEDFEADTPPEGYPIPPTYARAHSPFPLPPTPDPHPPVVGHLGGEVSPERAEPWRCPKHQGQDVRCGACADARRAHESEQAADLKARRMERQAAVKARAAAAKAAIEACDFCDDRGYTPAAKPCATDDAGRHVWASHYEEATR